jgi:transposase
MVVNPEHIATAKRMKADGHTCKDIAEYLGVSRATRYRYLAATAEQPDGNTVNVVVQS